MEYRDFISQKSQVEWNAGFNPTFLPDCLFGFQHSLCEWATRKGRAALLADCGLGKTIMQLVWSENVVRHTNKPVLILTPLAVSSQTIREAEKFGIEARRSQDGSLAPGAHTVVTNYERLSHFDPNDFAGCVCDESSCIKNLDGVRRAQITEFMRCMPYRLLASATASPNDYHELGTQSEALGALGYMDMLNRFFKNDLNNSSTGRFHGEAPKWRFKGHAETPFFRWVCSFARACRKPSDLGFPDDGFRLPPLVEQEHVVEARTLRNGFLFPTVAITLPEQREERRRTLQDRCEKVASLVSDTGEQALIWCQLNDEGDLLEDLIPGSIQITGTDRDEVKEHRWLDFASGKIRVVISKQKIGGWGLNLQNCAHIVMFPDHSFEAYYQGLRRCYRFGQQRPVHVDIVLTEGQRAVVANLHRKARAADRMFERLVELMNESLHLDRDIFHQEELALPSWI